MHGQGHACGDDDEVTRCLVSRTERYVASSSHQAMFELRAMHAFRIGRIIMFDPVQALEANGVVMRVHAGGSRKGARP